MDETTRKAREQSGVKAWGEWMAANKASIVDLGSPLGKTKRTAPEGVTEFKNNMTAYTVVQAESRWSRGIARNVTSRLVRFVAACPTGQAVGPAVFALALYLSDGTLDTGFGSGGKVSLWTPTCAFIPKYHC